MSEAMIKRWNEITMAQTEGPAASSLKRSRPRSRSPSLSEESEDNVSIASRSPSPDPINNKEEDISVYDNYIRGVVREPVTVDTKISSTNKGFGMLARMGWKEGQGLGASGEGRPDPIPFLVKLDAMGLGKASHEARVIESTVSQRRGLESERMIKETEEQRRNREQSVAAKEQRKTQVKDTLRPFYCEDCDKQYSNVAQYDEHVRSYAHAHVVRSKEQQATARQRQAGEIATRKAKEKKREEKEMKKMAAAAGIKYTPAVVASSLPVVPIAQPGARSTVAPGGGFAPVNDSSAKRSGWTAVNAAADSSGSRVAPVGVSGFKKSGWTATATTASPVTVPIQGVSTAESRKLSGAFTRGGWTTLDTTNSTEPDVEMTSPYSVTSPRPESFAVPPPPPMKFIPPPPPDIAPPPSPSIEDPPPPPPAPPRSAQTTPITFSAGSHV